MPKLDSPPPPVFSGGTCKLVGHFVKASPVTRHFSMQCGFWGGKMFEVRSKSFEVRCKMFDVRSKM